MVLREIHKLWAQLTARRIVRRDSEFQTAETVQEASGSACVFLWACGSGSGRRRERGCCQIRQIKAGCAHTLERYNMLTATITSYDTVEAITIKCKEQLAKFASQNYVANNKVASRSRRRGGGAERERSTCRLSRVQFLISGSPILG